MAQLPVEGELLEQSARLKSLEEYEVWIKKCNECIELLEETSRNKIPRLSVGARTSLVARIARLQGLKYVLERRFIHVGAGHSLNNAAVVWHEIETAFENRVLTAIVINYNHIEPRQFFEDARITVIENVRNILERYKSVKVNTMFTGEFVAGDKQMDKTISTKNYELFLLSDPSEWYDKHVVESTISSLEEFQERDSGWALSRILNLMINVNKYNPLHAGCHIKLPREIMLKHAVINVQSSDNACFAWSVVAALYPVQDHADRINQYPHYTTVLNLRNINFPMTLNQISKFEQLNDISINVYTYEKEKTEKPYKIFPIRLSSEKRGRHINMLYMQDQSNEGHFMWIKNLSRLVTSQLSKNRSKKYICNRYVDLKKTKFWITNFRQPHDS